ncbi:DNA glycosylase [Verrucomicrobium sp. GAS474]|uniref:DNA-3-methyladenine glycosylase family protein n=1 Tax=Verrucomicrobium sp. GAS474 TaxID=1882831 RepID=UPI001390229E|nr:DNA glycosylase [Verrucomicrobium sp. GAS474]
MTHHAAQSVPTNPLRSTPALPALDGLPDWPLVLTLPATFLDPLATLRCGQAFCWSAVTVGGKRVWRGMSGPHPFLLVEGEKEHTVHSPTATPAAAARYFNHGLDVEALLASFPDDPWMARALAYCGGMRIVRQEAWETLATFICSAVKQVPQIEAIHMDLRRTFGAEVAPGFHAFPTPAALAAAGEEALRRCRLGFRAKGLHGTAVAVAAGKVDLAALEHLPTDEARARLVTLPGVGPKIADCVLLFGYGRPEAFPIDVWVERILRRLYFRGKKLPSKERLQRFAETHFGPWRGHAQQYLFHWVRTARPPEAMDPPKKKAPKKKSKPKKSRLH